MFNNIFTFTIIILVLSFCGCKTLEGNLFDFTKDPQIVADYEKDVDVKINSKKAQTKSKDTEYYLIVKNTKTGNEWKLTYDEWERMTTSYRYWVATTNQRPTISEIKMDKEYIYIIFNYYDVNGEKVGFKIGKNDESILSGKVIISRKYLMKKEEKTKTILWGWVIGEGVYAALVTFLVIVLVAL